jgi:hypothetical protein
MQKIKKIPDDGDIFMIPLYLPSCQEWRKTYDEFIDYRKYKFNSDDIYAFGRIIECRSKNLYLMEIFSYIGAVPDNPNIITSSGRMFLPVMSGGSFDKGRWRIIFENAGYDKMKDSDYENISFLYADRIFPRIWKGGKEIRISKEQYDVAWKNGNPPSMGIYGAVQMENIIRKTLREQGVELNYEEIVEKRKSEYPQPRDIDKKLKEMITPFRWLSDSGAYTLYLDISDYNREYFAKHGMLGNGYDWEKLAILHLEENMPEALKKISFDCEADMFSASSDSKKILKEFALSFHELCTDRIAFEKMLKNIR